MHKVLKAIGRGVSKSTPPSQIAPVFDISPEGKLIFGL